MLREDGEPDLVDGGELVAEDVEGVLCVGDEGVDVRWLHCDCVFCAGLEVAADEVVDGEEGEAGGDCFISLRSLFARERGWRLELPWGSLRSRSSAERRSLCMCRASVAMLLDVDLVTGQR